MQQVESLLYLDQHNLFDPDMKVEEMTKLSFIRQQDIQVICDKIKTITEQIRKKQVVLQQVELKMNNVKESSGQKWW